MISEPPRTWSIAVKPVGLSGEGEVVHPRDAEYGVVDASALQAAVSEDLPGLHPGEDVLDAGPDLLVGLVVLLFPAVEFGLTALAAVRDDQSGARVAAVGDRERLADGGLGPGLLPRLAVVAVPSERLGRPRRPAVCRRR